MKSVNVHKIFNDFILLVADVLNKSYQETLLTIGNKLEYFGLQRRAIIAFLLNQSEMYLTLSQIADLFNVDVSTITRDLQRIQEIWPSLLPVESDKQKVQIVNYDTMLCLERQGKIKEKF